MDSDAPSPTRHKWDHFKPHHYFCLRCGTLKENVFENGTWIGVFYLPDGRKVFRAHVPPCEAGSKTAERLKRFAEIQAKTAGENKSDESSDPA
jgi:hypothetical protein